VRCSRGKSITKLEYELRMDNYESRRDGAMNKERAWVSDVAVNSEVYVKVVIDRVVF